MAHLPEPRAPATPAAAVAASVGAGSHLVATSPLSPPRRHRPARPGHFFQRKQYLDIVLLIYPVTLVWYTRYLFLGKIR